VPFILWSSGAQDDAHKRAEHGTEYKSGGEDQETNSVFGGGFARKIPVQPT
jgi:hypothetical protein